MLLGVLQDKHCTSEQNLQITCYVNLKRYIVVSTTLKWLASADKQAGTKLSRQDCVNWIVI